MTTKSKATPSAPAARKLIARINTAQKLAEAAKKQTKAAKADLKSAKKLWKESKRAAKAARKEVKFLKAELAALAARKPAVHHKSASRKPVLPEAPVQASAVEAISAVTPAIPTVAGDNPGPA
jgi:chromosome segregation ATPase